MICMAMPRAMKPAPTIPTLIGRPCSARFFSSVSRMNIVPPSLGEIRPAHIFFRDDGWLSDRPFDVQRGIIPTHTTFGLRRVIFGDEVSDLGVVLQRQEGV